MSGVPSASERLASIVDEKPIYLARHDCAALAIVKLIDYDAWCLAESEWLLTVLHQTHLRIDALVQHYGFYKVGCHAGEFSVAANVSGEVDRQAPGSLLQFANDVLRELRQVQLPIGSTPRVQISLSAGPLGSAILGKTALKYTVHGRPETIARKALQQWHGSEGCIIASKEFVNCLNGGMVSWSPVSPDAISSMGLHKEQLFLYESSPAQVPLINQAPPRRRTFAWRLLRLVPSLCFDDGDRERSFRLFQAERLSSFDVLYMSLSVSMVMIAVLRAWRYGVSPMGVVHLILSFVGTVIPLSNAVFWGENYRMHRHSFLALFRITKLLSITFFGSRPNRTGLMPTLLNYAILHGMHALGTNLVLPINLGIQVLSVVAIALKIMALCSSTDINCKMEGRSPLTAALLLFTVTLIVPSLVGYRVERQQRCVYSHGNGSHPIKHD